MNDRVTVKVFDVVGERCTDGKNGSKVASIITPHVRNGKVVMLDFTGVKVYSFLFAVTLFRETAPELGEDEIQDLIHVCDEGLAGKMTLMGALEESRIPVKKSVPVIPPEEPVDPNSLSIDDLL